MATFSCEDSSSRRSLRICCGERVKGVRGQALTLAVVAEAGDEQRVRAHLGLHLLLSLSAREQRETDRQRQAVRRAARHRQAQRKAEACTELPRSHPAPPAMHKAAQHGGGSYGGVGGGRARGQGQHRSVNCNRIKPGTSGCPWPAASPGAAGAGRSRVEGTELPVEGGSAGGQGRQRVGWQLLSTAHFSARGW